MAYTQTARKTRTGTRSNFGGTKTDGNRVAMMGPTGNIILTQDATGTPVVSPATVNTTQTLTVPSNAVSCTIVSVTNPVQISEDSTQSTYFSLPAGTPITIDCADMKEIYLKTGSSTVVSFMFKAI